VWRGRIEMEWDRREEVCEGGRGKGGKGNWVKMGNRRGGPEDQLRERH